MKYVMNTNYKYTYKLCIVLFYFILERGPLSLMSTTEELLDRKVAAPV
jgi:hypothetical protein